MAWDLQAKKEDLCRARGRDRTSSSAWRRITKDSLEKDLLLTGTVKLEIS
jgi:hypothetical protein